MPSASSRPVGHTQPGETSINYDSKLPNFTISNFLSVKQQREAFEANLRGLLVNNGRIVPYDRLTRAAMASHRGAGTEQVGGNGGPYDEAPTNQGEPMLLGNSCVSRR